ELIPNGDGKCWLGESSTSLGDPPGIVTQVPELILKLLYKELNALNTLENNRIVDLQKKLTRVIKTTVGKSVQRNVKKGSKVVFELLKYCVMKLDKADVNLHELVDLIRDLVILIDSASASTKAAPEGGENIYSRKQGFRYH
ncbi:hypothetical protein Tco_0985785, partial [Tanacetum coccineum]